MLIPLPSRDENVQDNCLNHQPENWGWIEDCAEIQHDFVRQYKSHCPTCQCDKGSDKRDGAEDCDEAL
jgi:hypothetical protein